MCAKILALTASTTGVTPILTSLSLSSPIVLPPIAMPRRRLAKPGQPPALTDFNVTIARRLSQIKQREIYDTAQLAYYRRSCRFHLMQQKGKIGGLGREEFASLCHVDYRILLKDPTEGSDAEITLLRNSYYDGFEQLEAARLVEWVRDPMPSLGQTGGEVLRFTPRHLDQVCVHFRWRSLIQSFFRRRRRQGSSEEGPATER